MVTSATLFLTYLRCFNYIFFSENNLCVCGQGDSVIYMTSVNTYACRGAAPAAAPRKVNRVLATQPERCCCCCPGPPVPGCCVFTRASARGKTNYYSAGQRAAAADIYGIRATMYCGRRYPASLSCTARCIHFFPSSFDANLSPFFTLEFIP